MALSGTTIPRTWFEWVDSDRNCVFYIAVNFAMMMLTAITLNAATILDPILEGESIWILKLALWCCIVLGLIFYASCGVLISISMLFAFSRKGYIALLHGTPVWSQELTDPRQRVLLLVRAVAIMAALLGLRTLYGDPNSIVLALFDSGVFLAGGFVASFQCYSFWMERLKRRDEQLRNT